MEYLWTVKIYYTCFSFMILSIPSRIYLSTTSSRKKSSRSQSDRVCPPSIRLPKFSQKVKLISRRRYMYRTCLIQLATDIPTSKLSNYNTRGERERERKSRLRLAFCPGSLPAIRRVNAALNARWLHSYTHTRHQRCEIIARNNARSSSIFDVRIIEPDGKEPPDGKILSSSSSLPSLDRCQLRFEHQFSARFRVRARPVSLCYV